MTGTELLSLSHLSPLAHMDPYPTPWAASETRTELDWIHLSPNKMTSTGSLGSHGPVSLGSLEKWGCGPGLLEAGIQVRTPNSSQNKDSMEEGDL